MSTRDPFETTPPHDGSREHDEGAADSRAWPSADGTVALPPTPSHTESGYAAPGYAAPGYASPQQPAPGFSTGPQAPQQPSYSYQAQTPPPSRGDTDGVSIAALVSGILGLGVVAVILGAVGLRRTAGGQRKGTGMAVAGIVLGLLGTIIATAATTWWAVETAEVIESEVWIDEDWDYESWPDVEGGSYGDDPYLDSLWDACAAGDDVACDDLFTESPWRSEYEEFGDTCGERGRPLFQTWCEEGRTD